MDFRDYTITPKAVLLLVFTLLAPSLTSAAFVIEFEVVSYVTMETVLVLTLLYPVRHL